TVRQACDAPRLGGGGSGDGEPAVGVVWRRDVERHRVQRHPLQPAARPGEREHRRRAADHAGGAEGAGAGRPLARAGPDRVRNSPAVTIQPQPGGTMAGTPATSTAIESRGYAHPKALVTTDWVAENLNDPSIRIVESDEDVLLYDTGHIPGAVKIDWHADLNDALQRDYLTAERFAELMSAKGITPETTVVFYGDKNNWWATYALWVFHLFGHTRTRIMDGGRKKWEDEGRELTTEV